MEIALDLAKARQGLTGPNPSVGCVIVKNDRIISIGQTSIKGRPHAETNAITNASDNLKGSTMYVTLEPCNHYGQTPPCTKAIINSNISKVIYSIIDIDKKVRGKTFQILKSNKIKVQIGLLKEKISEFYISYFFNKRKKLPFVSGKIAVTRNNLIYSKKNKKITNSLSNKFTHFLRYKNDSILVSYKTLNKDDPKLNCRLKNMSKFSPKRIILDSELKTNKKSYIYKTANRNNTIIFYNKATKSKILEFKKKGINLVKSQINSSKNFDISTILKKLFKMGCRNILIEGGNDLTKSFIYKKLFNQFYLFKSSKKFSKLADYKEFDGFNILDKNFKKRIKINSNFGNNTITLYKN